MLQNVTLPLPQGSWEKYVYWVIVLILYLVSSLYIYIAFIVIFPHQARCRYRSAQKWMIHYVQGFPWGFKATIKAANPFVTFLYTVFAYWQNVTTHNMRWIALYNLSQKHDQNKVQLLVLQVLKHHYLEVVIFCIKLLNSYVVK